MNDLDAKTTDLSLLQLRDMAMVEMHRIETHKQRLIEVLNKMDKRMDEEALGCFSMQPGNQVSFLDDDGTMQTGIVKEVSTVGQVFRIEGSDRMFGFSRVKHIRKAPLMVVEGGAA